MVPEAIRNFLPCSTPAAWIEAALAHPDELLIDHANCEKKAASTALGMLYRYVDRPELLYRLSRLAREELRHFEQVCALMAQQDVAYGQLSASRYAATLMTEVRREEPGRLVDTLLVGAIVEARSCERMKRLSEELSDPELRALYKDLLASEARHHHGYVDLCTGYYGREATRARLKELAAEEARILDGAPRDQVRMHT